MVVRHNCFAYPLWYIIEPNKPFNQPLLTLLITCDNKLPSSRGINTPQSKLFVCDR